jgi:hypothetical protein
MSAGLIKSTSGKKIENSSILRAFHAPMVSHATRGVSILREVRVYVQQWMDCAVLEWVDDQPLARKTGLVRIYQR